MQNASHVTIDVVGKQGGDIHLVGTKESIDKAKSDLVRVIERTEEMVDLSSKLREYLTGYKIHALADLRERHPEVNFGVARSNKSSENEADTDKISVRGAPADIADLKRTMEGMEVIETAMRLSNREAGMLVGKGGSNITMLVDLHQVLIDVQRPQKNVEIGETITRVKLLGPKQNVEGAKTAIELMVAENKDSDEKIPIDGYLRTVLLMNGGKVIQLVRKNVNDAINGTLSGDAPASAGVYVAVNVVEDGVTVKARERVMEKAKALVKAELAKLKDLFVHIKVDPFVIPVIIGKGGQGIQKLREGTSTVSIEVDGDGGDIIVCGLDADEIKKVSEAVQVVKANNQVKRIPLICDESEDGASSFSSQIKNFFRSPTSKETQGLVFMSAADDLKQIVLRGKPENLEKAVELVEKFVSLNYVEELCVTEEDVDALLSGGKESKISTLSAEHEGSLGIVRKKQAVICRGEKEAVTKALSAVREFLYGGADILVRNIELDSADLKGVLIGKGGKTKAELEEKFPEVSINLQRNEPIVTLRGPPAQVEECHVAVLKIVLGASVTKKIELTGKQVKSLQKSNFHRRLGQSLNVQMYISEEDCLLTIRGNSMDVDEASDRIHGELKGTHESRMVIGGGLFTRLKDAAKNPAHFDRIRKDSKAQVTLSDSSEAVIFSGQRQAVTKAKESVLTFLQFLLGDKMDQCKVESHVLAMVGKPFTLGEVEARTGARVCLDRDLASILVYSTDEGKTKAAKEMMQTKISDCEQLVQVVKLESSEDWLIASIIGKGGANIKKLRQAASGCVMDVQPKEMRVVLSDQDPEIVAKGKEILDAFVDTARKECLYITIPREDLPAFVGRAGAHIKKLSETYEVELQIMKTQGDALRITGSEEKVSAAQAAVETWLAAREAEELANNIEESKRLRPDQIPMVIGNRGAVINALSKEFGCRIDVDRLNSSVVARGGTPEKRAALFEKIDTIVSGESEEYSSDAAAAADKDKPSGTTRRSRGASKANNNTTPATKKVDFDYEKLLQAGNNFPTLGNQKVLAQKPLEMNWPLVKPSPPTETAKATMESKEAEEEDVDDDRDWRQEYYGVSW